MLIELARLINDMDVREIRTLLEKLKDIDSEAFDILKELVEEF